MIKTMRVTLRPDPAGKWVVEFPSHVGNLRFAELDRVWAYIEATFERRTNLEIIIGIMRRKLGIADGMASGGDGEA
jgi:hypothetical protein